MVLEFKTARNTYGHRNYLAVDTENKTFTCFCKNLIVDGMEIKATDYKSLINQLKEDGYNEV